MTTAVAEKTDTQTATDTTTKAAETAPKSDPVLESSAKPTSDSAKPETGTPDTKAEAKAQAPEKYEFKLPEHTPFTAVDLDRYADQAKAFGLTQDAAQAWVTKDAEAAVAQVAEWKAELAADPALGGAQLEATMALAQKGLDLAAPKTSEAGQFVQAFLASSGLSHHKAVVEVFANLGRLLSEDTIHAGGRSGGEVRKSTEEVLFGTPARS